MPSHRDQDAFSTSGSQQRQRRFPQSALPFATALCYCPLLLPFATALRYCPSLLPCATVLRLTIRRQINPLALELDIYIKFVTNNIEISVNTTIIMQVKIITCFDPWGVIFRSSLGTYLYITFLPYCFSFAFGIPYALQVKLRKDGTQLTRTRDSIRKPKLETSRNIKTATKRRTHIIQYPPPEATQLQGPATCTSATAMKYL